MFGFKIISEKRYRKAWNQFLRESKANDELMAKNNRLELDIKSLREQNSDLRAINAKQREENCHLIEKCYKMKKRLKQKQEVRNDKHVCVCPTRKTISKKRIKV